MAAEIDVKQLRNCFGKFATGVTVITTIDVDGEPVGLTVNSFSSLSLEPPMILWSLDKKSRNLEALAQATHFTVNVLASDQMDISNQFARSSGDKFAGIETADGKTGVPLLAGTVAHLECKKAFSYEGGDHIIFVGEVEHFSSNGKAPLLFTGGQYAVSARHPQVQLKDPEYVGADVDRHSSDDFIIPLLLRTFWEVSDPFYSELLDAGIPITQARILVHLTLGEPMTAKDLSAAIRIDIASVNNSLSILCRKDQLVKVDGDRYTVSNSGEDHLRDIRGRADRYEEELFDGYGAQDIEVLKSMLRALIYRKKN